MPERYFVCDSCGCLDSTSSGTYSNYNSAFLPSSHRGRRECCECAPVYDANGRPIAGNGRWHGRFKKTKATVSLCTSGQFEIAYFGALASDVERAIEASSLSCCPQCRSTEVGVARSRSHACVVCLNCGACGPRCASISDAIDTWNVLG